MLFNNSDDYDVTRVGANSSTPAISVPEGCVLLQFAEFNPFDNPDSLVTQDQERAFAAFITSVFFPVLFLIGVPGNVTTAIVFYRHGLKERANLCVFCQSLIDTGHVINVTLSIGDAIFHGFDNKGKANVVGDWYSTNNLSGFYGLDSSSKVLSAIIASERCFCVSRPLKAQGLMKTGTIAIIILLVVVVVTGGHFVVTARWTIRCLYNFATNTSFSAMMLSDFYLQNKSLVDFLDAVVYGIAIPASCIAIVSATTAYTAFKLKQMTTWRQKAASGAPALSRQDIALTRMLIGTAILFMICTVGYFCSRLVLLFNPDFNLEMRQANMFILISYLVMALNLFRSAFNFFVFFIIGSRFRKTVRNLFCRTSRDKISEMTGSAHY